MLQRSEKRCAFIEINLLRCHELLFYMIIKEQESALCRENKGDANFWFNLQKKEKKHFPATL